jgi:deoxyribose-phosphate aldolase
MPVIPQTKDQLAQYIDHTLLTATATEEQIRQLCRQAQQYHFYSVCILPRWADLCAELLQGSGVRICTVAGFPLGGSVARVKAYEADLAIASGADEIDMVADLAAIVSGDGKYLLNDIRTVVKPCQSVRPYVGLKVIIESAALTDEQIVFACKVAQDAGADFVKTSTGLHPSGGAKVEHVCLMAASAPKCKIKASGGIKTAADAMAMIAAGAGRIGTSASMMIIDQFATELPRESG